MNHEAHNAEGDSRSSPGRRRLLPIVMLIAAVTLIGGLWMTRDREPAYHGRRLSDLLVDLGRPASSGNHLAASNAVMELGNESLPVIVNAVDQSTPWHIKLILERQNNLPPAVRSRLFRWLDPYRHVDRRTGALRALELLGTNAAPAAAELVAAFERTDVNVASQLATALTHVGPAVVAHLRRDLTNSDLRKRSLAAFVMHQLGPASAPAAPELIAGLAGADENHRRLVAQTLARMGTEVLLHVTPLLASGDPETRLVAVRALSQLLPRARDLTPEMVGLLDDISLDVRLETASLLVNWWNLPAEEWRKHLRKLPEEHPSRALYSNSLAAFEGGEARLLEVLREGLVAPDPKRQLEAATRLVQLNRVNAEVVTALRKLNENFAGSPWEMSGLTNTLNRALQALTNASVSVEAPQTSSRPRTVPDDQSPPSAGSRSVDKSP